MINTNFVNLEVLNRNFNSFSTKTVNSRRPYKIAMISQLQQHEKRYKRIDCLDVFCANAGKLADGLCESGFTDLASIIYAHIIKIPNLNSEQRHSFLIKALNVARKQNDPVHILARVVDLKKFYFRQNQSQEYGKMLFEEENILSNIVENYRNAQNKYKTIGRQIGTYDTYKAKLAFCKVDIAKRLMWSDPETTMCKLNEALNMFRELRRVDEIKFVKKLMAKVNKK